MVEEHREAHASEWAVLQSVAPKLGCTAGVLEAVKGFRRVKGYADMTLTDAGRRAPCA